MCTILIVIYWTHEKARNSSSLRIMLRNGRCFDSGRDPQCLLPYLSHSSEFPVRYVSTSTNLNIFFFPLICAFDPQKWKLSNQIPSWGALTYRDSGQLRFSSIEFDDFSNSVCFNGFVSELLYFQIHHLCTSLLFSARWSSTTHDMQTSMLSRIRYWFKINAAYSKLKLFNPDVYRDRPELRA